MKSMILCVVAVAVLGSIAQGELITVSFQNGADGYAGQRDLAIRSDGGLWDDGRLLVDASPRVQVLIAFDNIFGSAAGQVPTGAMIESAALRMVTANSFPSNYSGTVNDIDVYKMDVAWDSSSRWSSFESGGLTHSATRISKLTGGVPNWSTAQFDVTAAVQAWANGTANYGLGLANEGGDGADFWNGVYAVAAERPQLVVTYSVPEPATMALLGAGALALARRRRAA